MISLKAANSNDQNELDDEVSRFEKIFLLLESPEEGERSNAARQVINSLARINQLLGKSPGQSGYFGLRTILRDADSSGAAQELERAKELIREFETNNKSLELEARCSNALVENLRAELERSRSIPLVRHDADRVKPFRKFLIGAIGISVAFTILLSGLLDFYSWVNVLLVVAVVLMVFPLSMRFIGGFCLKVGDEVQYRVARCAEMTVTGLKAIAFSFILLFLSGIAGGLFGEASLWGADLPVALSGEGLIQWMMMASAEVFGIVFLTAGAGFFLFIRWCVRGWNLPGALESLFS